MQGEPWSEDNPREKPSLKLGLHELNPRFYLYANRSDKKGSITFKIDPIILYQIFEFIHMLSKDSSLENVVFDLKSTYDHSRGGKQDRPVVIGKIMVGRNDKGLMFLAFNSRELGSKPATFVFRPSPWATPMTTGGEPYNEVKASESQSRGWADMFKSLIPTYMVVHGKEPEGKGGGGNSGYSKPKQNFDDAIPEW